MVRGIFLLCLAVTAGADTTTQNKAAPKDRAQSQDASKKTDTKTQTQATREDEIVNAFDNNDVSKLFSLYDKDNNKKLTSEEQNQFLSDLENISFLELPESFKEKAKADHGLTEKEFKEKYSALTGEFQDIQKEAIKEDLKQELKEEVTQLLADYDKDGDGKLSATEQRSFLEDLQKAYNVDLSDEMAAADAQSQEDLFEEPEEEQSFAAQPSDVVVFFVSAFVGAALTTLGIRVYRKKTQVALEDNYALLSA